MISQAVASAEAGNSAAGLALASPGHRMIVTPSRGPAVGGGFGAYRFVRELGPHAAGERWLALDPRTGSSCTVYRLTAFRGRLAGRRALEAIAKMTSVRHAHLLPVHQVGIDALHTPCVVTDYTGHHDGLVTLAQLLQAKGGRLPIPEAARAVGQITEACAAAHDAGLVHGPFTADDVLVDRFGQLWVELYGLMHLLRGPEGQNGTSAETEEARSLVALGRLLFLGRSDEFNRVEASRLGVPRRWASWLSRGTGCIPAFISVDQALAALPTRPPPVLCPDRCCTWRDWVRRIGQALGQ
jgi:serine/threonine protein kinase